MVGIGPVPSRFPADADLARRLVAAQFPQWAGLPVRRVADEGWDNRTFRLGGDMLIRLPSAAEYAEAVGKEQRWLPVFGPRLPLPVPVPLAQGAPGEGYPHHWSVYRWIDGEPAHTAAIGDPVRFAADLAGFLTALRGVDPAGGPGPGRHNWYRGGPLTPFDPMTRDALAVLSGLVATDAAAEVWEAALRTSWDRPPVWFHGDVATGNLLVHDGALAAVIDFGTSGVGDPACDLAIAWTLFSGESRAAFREGLAADPATWARGRGWALWKTLVGCAADAREGSPLSPDDTRVLAEIIADHEGAG